MTPLNDLYGPLSSVTFRAAIDRIPATYGDFTMDERRLPSGDVVLDLRWGASNRLAIHCRRRVLIYTRIEGPTFGPGKSLGFYAALVETEVPAWARRHGIVAFLARPADDEAESLLRSYGDWRPVPVRRRSRRPPGQRWLIWSLYPRLTSP